MVLFRLLFAVLNFILSVIITIVQFLALLSLPVVTFMYIYGRQQRIIESRYVDEHDPPHPPSHDFHHQHRYSRERELPPPEDEPPISTTAPVTAAAAAAPATAAAAVAVAAAALPPAIPVPHIGNRSSPARGHFHHPPRQVFPPPPPAGRFSLGPRRLSFSNATPAAAGAGARAAAANLSTELGASRRVSFSLTPEQQQNELDRRASANAARLGLQPPSSSSAFVSVAPPAAAATNSAVAAAVPGGIPYGALHFQQHHHHLHHQDPQPQQQQQPQVPLTTFDTEPEPPVFELFPSKPRQPLMPPNSLAPLQLLQQQPSQTRPALPPRTRLPLPPLPPQPSQLQQQQQQRTALQPKAKSPPDATGEVKQPSRIPRRRTPPGLLRGPRPPVKRKTSPNARDKRNGDSDNNHRRDHGDKEASNDSSKGKRVGGDADVDDDSMAVEVGKKKKDIAEPVEKRPRLDDDKQPSDAPKPDAAALATLPHAEKEAVKKTAKTDATKSTATVEAEVTATTARSVAPPVGAGTVRDAAQSVGNEETGRVEKRMRTESRAAEIRARLANFRQRAMEQSDLGSKVSAGAANGAGVLATGASAVSVLGQR